MLRTDAIFVTSLSAMPKSSRRQALMLSRLVGGGCTGRSAGARPSRAVVARRRRHGDSHFDSSTVSEPRPERKTHSLVTMAELCYFIIEQGNGRRCGRFILTQSSWAERGHRSLVIPLAVEAKPRDLQFVLRRNEPGRLFMMWVRSRPILCQDGFAGVGENSVRPRKGPRVESAGAEPSRVVSPEVWILTAPVRRL